MSLTANHFPATRMAEVPQPSVASLLSGDIVEHLVWHDPAVGYLPGGNVHVDDASTSASDAGRTEGSAVMYPEPVGVAVHPP